jgi:hypothetical protein
MGLIKFFKELFGSKKSEVCEVEVPAVEVVETKVEVPAVEVVETKVEVPVVKTEETKKPARRRSKAKTEKKEVEVISEKLAEVATEKVTAKDIKGKKKSEFPIEAPVAEVAPEKKSKPRRRRKPKPKTDEGQA